MFSTMSMSAVTVQWSRVVNQTGKLLKICKGRTFSVGCEQWGKNLE